MLFAANFKHTFVSWANARSSISILPKDSVMHFYGPYVVAQKQLKSSKWWLKSVVTMAINWPRDLYILDLLTSKIVNLRPTWG